MDFPYLANDIMLLYDMLFSKYSFNSIDQILFSPQLFLCESNAKSPYWPVNGIQCTPWDTWMEYGKANGYNAVWAPLKRNLTQTFNASAAWQFVEDHLGRLFCAQHCRKSWIGFCPKRDIRAKARFPPLQHCSVSPLVGVFFL